MNLCQISPSSHTGFTYDALLSAFLMLEAAGIGGPMLGLVLLPGLLAAGIGELVFIGLDSLTGFGTFSLAIPRVSLTPALFTSTSILP